MNHSAASALPGAEASRPIMPDPTRTALHCTALQPWDAKLAHDTMSVPTASAPRLLLPAVVAALHARLGGTLACVRRVAAFNHVLYLQRA